MKAKHGGMVALGVVGAVLCLAGLIQGLYHLSNFGGGILVALVVTVMLDLFGGSNGG